MLSNGSVLLGGFHNTIRRNLRFLPAPAGATKVGPHGSRHNAYSTPLHKQATIWGTRPYSANDIINIVLQAEKYGSKVMKRAETAKPRPNHAPTLCQYRAARCPVQGRPGGTIAAGTAPRKWPLCVLRARACQNPTGA